MNRERVQELRDVIAGIPENRIDLNSVWQNDPCGKLTPPKPCGTVACIAGWAMIYVPFVDAGIQRADGYTTIQKVRSFLQFDFEHFPVLHTKQDGEPGTDKEIALRRLDALLAKS